MFVAAYRIAFDGWTVHEMRAFHYKEFLHPNMKWYVRKFPERLVKSPVLAPYREMPQREEQLPAGPASREEETERARYVVS